MNRSFLNRQFLRFLLVGSLNTLVGYMAFVLFLYLNCHYAVASFLVIVCGILFDFNLNPWHCYCVLMENVKISFFEN